MIHRYVSRDRMRTDSRKDLSWVLHSRVMTEKAAVLSQNTVCFFVDADASKIDIARAVESFFGVHVQDVRVSTLPGKVKLFRRVKGVRSDRKKAFVRLRSDELIDFEAWGQSL